VKHGRPVPDTHEHAWSVVASSRDASGDWRVIRRCRFGIERYTVETDRPDDDDGRETLFHGALSCPSGGSHDTERQSSSDGGLHVHCRACTHTTAVW
jgi:hypothetical protein